MKKVIFILLSLLFTTQMSIAHSGHELKKLNLNQITSEQKHNKYSKQAIIDLLTKTREVNSQIRAVTALSSLITNNKSNRINSDTKNKIDKTTKKIAAYAELIESMSTFILLNYDKVEFILQSFNKKIKKIDTTESSTQLTEIQNLDSLLNDTL